MPYKDSHGSSELVFGTNEQESDGAILNDVNRHGYSGRQIEDPYSPFSRPELKSDRGSQEQCEEDEGFAFRDNHVVSSNWVHTPVADEWCPETESDAPRFQASQLKPSFRGSGPKGYERDDHHIKAAICELLTHAADIDASDINVEVKDNVVTLSGMVNSQHEMRSVEDLIADNIGIKRIQNLLNHH